MERLLIDIHGKFYFTVRTISNYFWSVNGTNLVNRLYITFRKCQDTQTLFIFECT